MIYSILWLRDKKKIQLEICSLYPAAHEEGIKPVNPAAGLQLVMVSVNVLE